MKSNDIGRWIEGGTRTGDGAKIGDGAESADGAESGDAAGEAIQDAVRKHIVVTGLVQGVGFRYETLRHARRIGVVGWVRNRRDGAVELEVQGEPERVAEMIEWLWQGPQWSRVDDVEVESMVPYGRLQAESTFIVTR